MKGQACPNCHVVNDTGVYVSGQRHRCVGCGIHFEVRRSENLSSVERGSSSVLRPVPTPRPPELQISGPQASGPMRGDEGTTVRAAEPPVEALNPSALDRTYISKPPAKVVVPGYELIEVVGRGGMGEVWRAQQQSLGRFVALKLLPPNLAQDPEFVARFGKESTALAALSHPNITQIIDRGVADHHYYFVMEFVQGQSLRDRLNAGPVKASEALKIVCQICRAVEYAHDQKIIHRDLKPENILLDTRGNVKVADFGLAGISQREGAGPQLTATSVAMGTVNYMAPEQRRDAKHVDGRADLYSLGILLYEMLTGEVPLGRFRMPSEKVPGLDPRFDDLVGKLLESEPAQRPAGAAEVLTVLEELLADHTSSAHAPSAPPGPRPVITRPDRPAVQSVSQSRMMVAQGWKGLRTGLIVVGCLAMLGVLIRVLGGDWQLGRDGLDVQMGAAKLELPLHRAHGHAGAGQLPGNTDGELPGSSSYTVDSRGLADLKMRFVPGGHEVIHAHAGSWSLEEGKLKATQGGDRTNGTGPLIPRAYVDDRFFSSDDFTAEAEVRVDALDLNDFPIERQALSFAELAFRLNDVQVSAFADPKTGMRLAWKYPTATGDQAGNSGRDVQAGLADVVPVPMDRTFVLKLTLHRRDNGTQVEASVDDQVFARNFLPGLRSQTGKVALGCRNLHCVFDSLRVQARPGVDAVAVADNANHEHAEH